MGKDKAKLGARHGFGRTTGYQFRAFVRIADRVRPDNQDLLAITVEWGKRSARGGAFE